MEEIIPYLFIAAVVLLGPWVLIFTRPRRNESHRWNS